MHNTHVFHLPTLTPKLDLSSVCTFQNVLPMQYEEVVLQLAI